jgi:hypothetical protein
MKFSGFQTLMWGLSFWTTAALVGVLLVRGRWREFPIFTSMLAFDTARSVVLYVLYRHGLTAWYARVYWPLLWPDFALQLGVAIEIGRIVLRPTGTWVRDARSRFAAAAVGGIALAALLTWWVSPPMQTARAIWHVRGNLFTSLVICELFVAMGLTANRLGLGWRSHVMAVGQGLTVWSSITVATTALQSYVGFTPLYRALDQVRGIAFLGAVLWMLARLWVSEPARQPLAPELERYILALHQRVEYDLRRIGVRN